MNTNSSNILLDIYKWWKPLLLITLISSLVAVIGSSSFFITPKFKSTAVIYPTTTNSISQALLVEHNPYRKDVLEFGEELESERMLQILHSDEMKNRIIEEFNLYSHYEIDSTSRYAKTWMKLAFEEHFSFKKTELMSIDIITLDKNSKMAADMCNRIVDLIDPVLARVKKERAEQASVILERRDKELSNRLFKINDSLEILRSYGVLDVSLQAERLTEYYAKALFNGNSSGARALKKEFNILATYGGAYFRLFEQLELVQEQLEIIRLEKENIRIELDANLTNRFVINRAYPADKKSYPIRWLLVCMTGLSSFVLTLLFLYLQNSPLLKNID